MLLAALLTTAAVEMVEPRAYGHGVGDLVERRASFVLPAGAAIAPDSLPRRGRVDVWLELRDVRSSAHELRLVYQIVNAPKQVATIELPALSLQTVGARDGARIDIGAWPITVSALTPAAVIARAGLEEMQPDIVPQRAPLAPTLLRLAASTLLLAALVYALALRRHPQLAFWRTDPTRAPFRRAWIDLRRLARRGGAPREAMTRLHAAFDAAAGQAVFADQLGPLYAARPQLRALAGEIDAFFARSRALFFDAANIETHAAMTDLLALARALARAEASA